MSRPLLHQVAALERTALAWERTAISLAALGLLLVKLVDLGAASQAAGLLLTGMAAVVVLVVVPLGYRRARLRAAPVPGRRGALAGDRWRPRVLLATALTISLTAAAVAFDAVLALG